MIEFFKSNATICLFIQQQLAIHHKAQSWQTYFEKYLNGANSATRFLDSGARKGEAKPRKAWAPNLSTLRPLKGRHVN